MTEERQHHDEASTRAAGGVLGSPAGVQALVLSGSHKGLTKVVGGRLTIGNASAAQLEHRGRAVDLAPFARANVARFAVSSDGSLVAAD